MVLPNPRDEALPASQLLDTALVMEDLIKERLAVCALEIYGVQSTWKGVPATAIIIEDMPSAYTLTGPTVGVSNPDEAGSSRRGFLVAREFIQRLIVAPFPAGDTDIDIGSEGAEMCDPFLTRFLMYYQGHPRLHTQTLPMMRHVERITDLGDSGTVVRTAPGGSECFSIDFSLTVVYRVKTPIFPVPYNS